MLDVIYEGGGVSLFILIYEMSTCMFRMRVELNYRTFNVRIVEALSKCVE